MVLNFASIYQRTDIQQTARGLSGPPEYTMKRLIILLPLIVLSTGCQGLLHELQPHRLWRLNYQEPAGRTDGVYFSVDDDLNPVDDAHIRSASK